MKFMGPKKHITYGSGTTEYHWVVVGPEAGDAAVLLKWYCMLQDGYPKSFIHDVTVEVGLGRVVR